MAWPTYAQLLAAARKLHTTQPALPSPLEGDAARPRLRAEPGAAPALLLFVVEQIGITRHAEALTAYLLAGGELRPGEQNRTLLFALSAPSHALIRDAAERTAADAGYAGMHPQTRLKAGMEKVDRRAGAMVEALADDSEPLVI